MKDSDITSAALRWHTVNQHRLEIGAEQGRYQMDQKQRNGFGGSSHEIGQRLTAAKRMELAALRQLAKACSTARLRQKEVDDVVEIELPTKVTRFYLSGRKTELSEETSA